MVRLLVALALVAPAAHAEPPAAEMAALDRSPQARWSPPLISLIVDPWREARTTRRPAVGRDELDQIVDPWAKRAAPVRRLPVSRWDVALAEIVDPWTKGRPRVPTAVFPPVRQ